MEFIISFAPFSREIIVSFSIIWSSTPIFTKIIIFKNFGLHYYNGVNLKSGHLSLKSKKVCTPLVSD